VTDSAPCVQAHGWKRTLAASVQVGAICLPRREHSVPAFTSPFFSPCERRKRTRVKASGLPCSHFVCDRRHRQSPTRCLWRRWNLPLPCADGCDWRTTEGAGRRPLLAQETTSFTNVYLPSLLTATRSNENSEKTYLLLRTFPFSLTIVYFLWYTTHIAATSKRISYQNPG